MKLYPFLFYICGKLRSFLQNDDDDDDHHHHHLVNIRVMIWTCIHCCSVTNSCPILCNPMDCSMPGFSVLHYLPEFSQTHVHWIGNAIHPSYPPLPLSSPALNLSQHQSLFKQVGSSHQVAEVLELQLYHQSFQWIFRVDFI